jgi:hypothetical protein
MTTEDIWRTIERQNEVIICLLSRIVWKPEDIAEIVSRGKRNPEAYRKVYNALDGEKTGKALASQAGVTPAAISYLLQTWAEEGIVLTVGPESKRRYKRLMSIPLKGKKGKAITNGE